MKIETLYSHKTLRYVTICKEVQVEHLAYEKCNTSHPPVHVIYDK